MRATASIGSTITLENRYGSYRIETPAEDLDIYDLIEKLVRPVLLAAGYAEATVDSALGCEIPAPTDE